MSESWLNKGWGLIEIGGPVMYVLLAFSVLALAIVLLKIFHFTRLGLRRTAFVDSAIAHLQKGETGKAGSLLGATAHPVARVMESAIATLGLNEKDRDAEIGRVGSGQIRNMESLVGGLEITANLCPLLGLFGTVLGMIAAFNELEHSGSEVDPTILAGGIWEALLTTAFGLAIAIPALGAFYLLESEVERVRSAMKDAVIRVNTALSKKR